MTHGKSVVVPVDAEKVLDAAAAYLKQQYGASHGLDHPIDRERILSSIPPAPAPLAGGEVLDGVARIIDPEAFRRWEGCKGVVEDRLRVDRALRKAGTILAALSPEAPARDGVMHPDAQPFERFPELALHIERMAMTGLVGSGISWDAFLRELNAALTPRHEAPASEDEARRKLIQCIEQWDGETEYDADDLASLADSILHAFNGPPVVSPAAPVQLSSNPCQLEAPAEGAGEREAIARIIDPRGWKAKEQQDAIGAYSDYQVAESLTKADAILALRARSSAPEAREVKS